MGHAVPDYVPRKAQKMLNSGPGGMMEQLFVHAASGDADALGGVAALVSTIAIIPAALLFIINQWHQIALLRDEKLKLMTDQYQMFLDKCLAFPRLRLEECLDGPALAETLSSDEKYQRDVLFELLVSIFEQAFLIYADRISTDRSRQWNGWERYIRSYARRSDFRDWWVRSRFEGDPEAVPTHASALRHLEAGQYDERFEEYMFVELIRSGPLERLPDEYLSASRVSSSELTN